MRYYEFITEAPTLKILDVLTPDDFPIQSAFGGKFEVHTPDGEVKIFKSEKQAKEFIDKEIKARNLKKQKSKVPWPKLNPIIDSIANILHVGGPVLRLMSELDEIDLYMQGHFDKSIPPNEKKEKEIKLKVAATVELISEAIAQVIAGWGYMAKAGAIAMLLEKLAKTYNIDTKIANRWGTTKGVIVTRLFAATFGLVIVEAGVQTIGWIASTYARDLGFWLGNLIAEDIIENNYPQLKWLLENSSTTSSTTTLTSTDVVKTLKQGVKQGKVDKDEAIALIDKIETSIAA